MEQAEKSFFEQLWERRIFQIVGSYLIGGWAFVQFTDWVVERYALASGWTEFVIVFLMVLLPSVIMLTWYHGRPGPDQWRKIEKVFIPINIVFAGLLGFVVFPESITAQVQEIKATTEEGDTIVRTVPTLAFQERIAIFRSNGALDADDDWMKDALPILANLKLEQDMRFTTVTDERLKNLISDYGFDTDAQVPKNIYRTAAEDVYADHYIVSDLKKESDQFVLNYSLRSTKTGAEKKSGTLTGGIYKLADLLHDDIRSSILLSDFVGIKDYINLDATSLISGNEEALKAYVNGLNQLWDNRGSQEGLEMLVQATKIDSTCSECYSKAGQYGMPISGIGFKKEQIAKAMQYYKALPERQQLDIKYWKYFPEESEKIHALCNLWMKLYPMDSKPYNRSMTLYGRQLQLDRAILVGEEALTNGHGGGMYIDLARLYTTQGNIEKSNELIQKFALQHPKRAKTISEVGLAYLFSGQVDKGIDFFKSRTLIEPDKSKNYVELANAYTFKGDLINVFKSYDEALEVAKDARDSIGTYQAMEMVYGVVGKFENFKEIFEKRKNLIRKIAAPISADASDMFPYIVGFYKQSGQENEVKVRLKEFIKTYSSPAYEFKCAININFFIGTDNGDSLSYYLNQCQDYIKQTDGEDVLLLAGGVASLSQGRYDESITQFEAYCKSTGLPSFQLAGLIGKAYFKKGDLVQAEKLFQQSIQFSNFNPYNSYLMAQVQKAKGKTKKAREFAEKALENWSEADPSFTPKIELLEFMSSL